MLCGQVSKSSFLIRRLSQSFYRLCAWSLGRVSRTLSRLLCLPPFARMCDHLLTGMNIGMKGGTRHAIVSLMRSFAGVVGHICTAGGRLHWLVAALSLFIGNKETSR